MRQVVVKLSMATFVCALHTDAFLQHRPVGAPHNSPTASTIRRIVGDMDADHRKQSFFLSLEEINPLITLKKDTSSMKVVNAFGIWCAVVSLTLAPMWLMAMSVVKMAHDLNEDFDPQRAMYDQ